MAIQGYNPIQAAIMANPSQIAGGDLTPQQQEQLAATRRAPSVSAGIPAPAPAPAPAGSAGLAPGGATAQPGYNPSAGQVHTGNPVVGPANVLVNPVTGGYMSVPGRDQQGNITLRPGEQGYQSPFQRANLDPYAQRIAQVGDIQMQRGLAGATLAGLPQVDADRMRAAQIDRTGFNRATLMQDQLAGRGNAAIGGLEAAAAGQVPSVAALQQQQGIEQAQQAAMAMGASARGGLDARAAAQRGALAQGAQIAQAGVNQAAQLRAAEMAQARGDLVGAIGQQQGLAQGLGGLQAQMAQAQAGFGQQAGLANQNANLQAALANQQGYLGATGMDQQLIGQGGNLFGTGANLGMAGTAFNNAQAQADIDAQMRQQDLALGYYGVNQGVAAQREAAQQQANAAMVGAALQGAGTLGGAAINYFKK